MTKIYYRITKRKQIESGTYPYAYDNNPIIYVTFPVDEKKVTDAGGKADRKAFSDEWLECRSDESNKSDYDYKYEEDPDNMVVKKYKRNKGDAN